MTETSESKPEVQFYLVFDITSTIFDEETNETKQPEIIEITVIPIDAVELIIPEEHFHSYVLPTMNPILSKKCKEFHSNLLFQYRIDQSPTWPNVLKSLEEWMKLKKYTSENSKIMADGSFLYEKNLVSQSKVSKMQIPHWMKEWINIRKDFKEGTGSSETLENLNVYRMLEIAGIRFEGVKMNGRDEAFHLALLALNMIRQHHAFDHFEKINVD